MKPDILAHKAFEPVLLIGRQKLKNLDIRLRVRGGGHVSQIYGAQHAVAVAAASRSCSLAREGGRAPSHACMPAELTPRSPPLPSSLRSYPPGNCQGRGCVLPEV